MWKLSFACVIGSALMLIQTPAGAEVQADLLKCQQVRDQVKRVACYDKVAGGIKAALPTTNAWAKEPGDFLRVSFGSPIEASTPLCTGGDSPRSLDAKELAKTGTPVCLDRSKRKLIVSKSLNDVGIIEARVNSLSDPVEEVTATFFTELWPSVREMLIEKYGSPTTTSAGKLVLKNGNSLDTETLRWTGVKISIVATSMDERRLVGDTLYDLGSLTAISNAHREGQNAEASRTRATAGGNL